MLKLAKLYETQLNELYMNTIYQERFKYFNYSNYSNYDVELKNDSWNELEFVSVDKEDNVIGFLAAKIDRVSDHVSSLKIINFYDINITFSRDFHQFLNDLFIKFNFRKICFSVLVGNPAETMYDKYINKYNGRVVGTYKDDVRLFDGKYYDCKAYEIFKSDYLNAIKM